MQFLSSLIGIKFGYLPLCRAPRLLIQGYCSAGKSVLAAMCANRFRWKLIDFDDWLYAKTGLPLEQVINQELIAGVPSELVFAKYYNHFQQDIYRMSNLIIALPFNFFYVYQNFLPIQKLNSNNYTVWLKEDLEVLWQRVQNNERYQHLFGSQSQFERIYHQVSESYQKANAIIYAQPELELTYMAIQHTFRAF